MNRTGLASTRKDIFFLIVVFFVIHGGVFYLVKDMPLLADEKSYHFPYIHKLFSHFSLNALFSERHRFSMFPTYHVFVTLLERAIGTCSIGRLRAYSWVMGLLAGLVFYCSAKQIEPETSFLKTLQFIFFPLLFPFFFLIYTDVLSLFLVLLGIYYALRNRVGWSGVFSIASIAVRQSNVVWAAFAFLWIYRQRKTKTGADIISYLRQALFFVLGFLALGIFLLINGGVSTANKFMVPSFHLYLGNIHFILFCSAILFLPLLRVSLTAAIPRVKKNVFFWMLLLVLVVAIASFKNDHPYNQIEFFIRNRVLLLIEGRGSWKVLYGFVATIALLFYFGVPMKLRRAYSLYLFTVVFLIPNWLIEPRYYMIPLTLFLLFRERYESRFELIFLIYSLLLCIIVMILIYFGILFI